MGGKEEEAVGNGPAGAGGATHIGVDSGFRVGKRTAYVLLALAVGTVVLVGLIVYYVGVAGVECQAGDASGSSASSSGSGSQGGGKKKVRGIFLSTFCTELLKKFLPRFREPHSKCSVAQPS